MRYSGIRKNRRFWLLNIPQRNRPQKYNSGMSIVLIPRAAVERRLHRQDRFLEFGDFNLRAVIRQITLPERYKEDADVRVMQ